MFYNNPKTQEKIYNFVEKAEKLESKMQILPVDFDKPWWDIIWRQKASVIRVVIAQIVLSVFDSIFPILIGYAILRLDLSLFLVIMFLKMFLTGGYNFIARMNTIFQIQTMSSIEHSANLHFLSVDPIFHKQNQVVR